MRILMITDLEGISGVVTWDQTRDENHPYYQGARKLLMAEIDAAVEGCLAGGATEVVAFDGHKGGFNFVPELMHPKAKYVTGKKRPPTSQREAFYQGFDAAILLGYHAMQGTADGILQHSQSSLNGNRYWYNERESGEIAQMGLVLGHFDIPIIMVSGDRAACREAGQFFGEGLVAVAVKEGYSEQFGLLVAPAQGQEMVREGARRALGQLDRCAPYQIELPIRGRLQFSSKEVADAFQPSRSKRVDERSYEAEFSRALEVMEF